MPKDKCSVPRCAVGEVNNIRLVYRIPKVRWQCINSKLHQSTLSPIAEVTIRRRNAWLKALHLDPNDNAENFLVCSRHFVCGEFNITFNLGHKVYMISDLGPCFWWFPGKPASNQDTTNIDWIPTLNLSNPAKVAPKAEKLLDSSEPSKLSLCHVLQECNLLMIVRVLLGAPECNGKGVINFSVPRQLHRRHHT